MTVNPKVNPKKLRPYDTPPKRRRSLIPGAPDSAATGFMAAAGLWFALAAGLGVLALAMTCAIFLISHIIFGEATAIAVTIPSAMVFALLWYIVPWLRGQGVDRQF